MNFKELIVLKLGGSVLTDRDKPFTADQNNIRRLSGEVARGYNEERDSLVIVHGAGSFGHPIVLKTGIHKGITRPEQLLAFAETQSWQNHLNVLVTKALQKEGLAAIPYQASSHSVMNSGRLIWMPLDTLTGFLEIGLIPVLYGVPAYDRVKGCSILSGDQIVSYLARQLVAKKIIHGTNVNGIYTDDPTRNPKAKLLKEITIENIEVVKGYLTKSSYIDVTGGMLGKVVELMGLAGLGITSEIVNAIKVGLVERSLAGESGLGTVIKI